MSMKHLSSNNRAQGIETGWAREICKTGFQIESLQKPMPRDVGKMEGETARDRKRERERQQQGKLHRRFIVDTVYRYIDSPVLMGRASRMENDRHSLHHSMSQDIYKSGWILSLSAEKYVSILYYTILPELHSLATFSFSNWGSMRSLEVGRSYCFAGHNKSQVLAIKSKVKSLCTTFTDIGNSKKTLLTLTLLSLVC